MGKTKHFRRSYDTAKLTALPAVGDILWTLERADDARYPLPEVGDAGSFRLYLGIDWGGGPEIAAVVDEIGALKTGVGGNSWYVAWRIVDVPSGVKLPQ